MQDADAFISPEPIRFMYDSDEDHVRAWLAWAEQTPGGWRARLAANGLTSEGDMAADGAEVEPRPKRRFLVHYVKTPSPCCGTEVLVDPDSSPGRLGLCSTCGTVMSHKGARWERAV